jgi:redox-sensitive bicupin YhaK (pirin superfamily)
MINIRKSEDRGHADHGWLNAKHTFSFGGYYDNRFVGFRDLRVINEDQVEADMGFPTHAHKDMEILTYVLEGALQHKDSMGNGSVIRPGDVQYMSAGSGVNHSEFNHSREEPVHLLQIWILPEKRGEIPAYDQKSFSRESRLNQLGLLASKDGRQNSIQIRQDVNLYGSLLDAQKTTSLKLEPKRFAWIQVAQGEIEVNGEVLAAGDGAAIGQTEVLNFKGLAKTSEFLVFDLV